MKCCYSYGPPCKMIFPSYLVLFTSFMTWSFRGYYFLNSWLGFNFRNVEKPKDKNPERMYKRPGFDNVPSY